MKSIYFAGPDVFSPDADLFFERIKQYCLSHQVKALIPVEVSEDHPSAQHRAQHIFKGNVQLLDKADMVIAHLCPFRGPSSDAGTIWEVGYAYAHGKPVLAFSEDALEYRQKIQSAKLNEANEWVDDQGWAIEDFGFKDNLMIQCSVQGWFTSLDELFKSPLFKKILQSENGVSHFSNKVR